MNNRLFLLYNKGKTSLTQEGNGSKGAKIAGLVADEEKIGSFCGFFFDTEDISD